MSNSPLIKGSIITNNSSARTQKITKFTPHYMAGNMSAKNCANYFATTTRQASSNYCIGSDGEIWLSVPENRRAWTSSSAWNDQRAITVEVANVSPDGRITDAAWESLVALGADVCKRNGIDRIVWTGTKDGSLTCHYMFASTSCPGEYLRTRMQLLADTINDRLHPKPAEPPKPTVVPKPAPGEGLGRRPDVGDVSRLYNAYNGDHLITANANEKKGLVG